MMDWITRTGPLAVVVTAISALGMGCVTLDAGSVEEASSTRRQVVPWECSAPSESRSGRSIFS